MSWSAIATRASRYNSAVMSRQWFISDLHLSADRPQALALFERFAAELPLPDDRLYILGDLFDAWIGDDDDSDLADRVRSALRTADARGVKVSIQRGNRDFLMGRRLMHDCGATLLPDCHLESVAGRKTLLMHGDLLCTDDVDYMKVRRWLRNPVFQWFMLRKPLAERRRIAADYRRRSAAATSSKPADIMDVNPDTVVRYLRRFDVRQLIHGHTHRPALHEITLPDGHGATRLVLPEWHDDAAMAWLDDGRRLRQVPVAAD
jgi:UDP-2,3-diacylglucosamine hydrolase